MQQRICGFAAMEVGTLRVMAGAWLCSRRPQRLYLNAGLRSVESSSGGADSAMRPAGNRLQRRISDVGPIGRCKVFVRTSTEARTEIDYRPRRVRFQHHAKRRSNLQRDARWRPEFNPTCRRGALQQL